MISQSSPYATPPKPAPTGAMDAMPLQRPAAPQMGAPMAQPANGGFAGPMGSPVPPMQPAMPQAQPAPHGLPGMFGAMRTGFQNAQAQGSAHPFGAAIMAGQQFGLGMMPHLMQGRQGGTPIMAPQQGARAPSRPQIMAQALRGFGGPTP